MWHTMAWPTVWPRGQPLLNHAHHLHLRRRVEVALHAEPVIPSLRLQRVDAVSHGDMGGGQRTTGGDGAGTSHGLDIRVAAHLEGDGGWDCFPARLLQDDLRDANSTYSLAAGDHVANENPFPAQRNPRNVWHRGISPAHHAQHDVSR